MSKEKRGEFIEVVWAYEEEYIPVRGHVTREEFNAAIGKYGYEPLGTDDVIRHTYWRCVPDRTGESDFRYVFDCKPGPGAFAVTVLEVA